MISEPNNRNKRQLGIHLVLAEKTNPDRITFQNCNVILCISWESQSVQMFFWDTLKQTQVWGMTGVTRDPPPPCDSPRSRQPPRRVPASQNAQQPTHTHLYHAAWWICGKLQTHGSPQVEDASTENSMIYGELIQSRFFAHPVRSVSEPVHHRACRHVHSHWGQVTRWKENSSKNIRRYVQTGQNAGSGQAEQAQCPHTPSLFTFIHLAHTFIHSDVQPLELFGVMGLAQGSNYDITLSTAGFELVTFWSWAQHPNPLTHTPHPLCEIDVYIIGSVCIFTSQTEGISYRLNYSSENTSTVEQSTTHILCTVL